MSHGLSPAHRSAGFRERRVRQSSRVSVRHIARAASNSYRLKTANEGRQRTTRQLRAEGKLPAHEAHWFEPCTDPDSGERMWEPKRTSDGEVKFWAEREQAGQKGEWEGVDHIFVEDGDQ